MELMIYDPKGAEALPEIKWNYEEIKAYALEKAQEYKSIAYTDADAAAMKKDRADINRFILALDAERKNKKKEYMKPYMAFEEQVKDALLPLREAADLISQGLEEIEQQYRDEKKARMEQLYEKYAGDLAGLVPFARTVKEEYYKRAFTDKKLEQAYADFFFRVREDLAALEELPERFRDKAALKYVESFNLSDALREGKRLEEMEKALAERREKQEREAAAMKPEDKEPEADKAEEPVQRPEETGAIGEVPEEKQYQMDFRVWGTQRQIMGLRQYLLDNHIRFGKVD